MYCERVVRDFEVKIPLPEELAAVITSYTGMVVGRTWCCKEMRRGDYLLDMNGNLCYLANGYSCLGDGFEEEDGLWICYPRPLNGGNVYVNGVSETVFVCREDDPHRSTIINQLS